MPQSAICRSGSSGGGGVSRARGTSRVERSARLSQLSQPKRVAQRREIGRRRRPPPPMGMPLAHYWAVRVAQANWRHHGSGGRGTLDDDLAARASQVQHEIEAAIRGVAAWDSTPAEGLAAEPSGWNNDFGGAGAKVSLARPDPLPQHVLARRARSIAWHIDLAHPPQPPPPVDPYAAKNQEQASAMGAWRQLQQSYRRLDHR